MIIGEDATVLDRRVMSNVRPVNIYLIPIVLLAKKTIIAQMEKKDMLVQPIHIQNIWDQQVKPLAKIARQNVPNKVNNSFSIYRQERGLVFQKADVDVGNSRTIKNCFIYFLSRM